MYIYYSTHKEQVNEILLKNDQNWFPVIDNATSLLSVSKRSQH